MTRKLSRGPLRVRAGLALLLITGGTLFLAGCGAKPEQAPPPGPKTTAAPTPQAAQLPMEPEPEPPATKEPQSPQLDKVATGLRNAPVYNIAVRSIAFDSDGTHLAVGRGDGTLEWWNLGTKDLAWKKQIHENWVFDIAWAPDKTLITGGGDNLIHRIDPETGEILETFRDHTGDLHGVAVTPDGQWLLSGGDDGRVLLRSLTEGTVQELGSHDKAVTGIALSPDGLWAASSSRDQLVKLWNLKEQKLQHNLSGHTQDVLSVAFSPDGTKLLSASYDLTARLWDIENGAEWRRYEGHADWVFIAIFNREGTIVYTGDGSHGDRRRNGGIRAFETDSTKMLQKLALGSDVADLALSPAGDKLAAGLSSGRILFYQVQDQKLIDHREEIGPPKVLPSQPTTQDEPANR